MGSRRSLAPTSRSNPKHCSIRRSTRCRRITRLTREVDGGRSTPDDPDGAAASDRPAAARPHVDAAGWADRLAHGGDHQWSRSAPGGRRARAGARAGHRPLGSRSGRELRRAPPADAKLANPWEPFDIDFDGRGRAFVTDGANGLVHRFSPGGRWEKAFAGFGKVTYLAIDCDDRIHLVIDVTAGVRTIDTEGNDLPASSPPRWRPNRLANRFPAAPFPVDMAGDLQ